MIFGPETVPMQSSGIFAQPTDIFSAGVEESEYGMSVQRDYFNHPSQKVNIMVDIPSMGNPNPLQEES